jgi:hypothetical protein
VKVTRGKAESTGKRDKEKGKRQEWRETEIFLTPAFAWAFA